MAMTLLESAMYGTDVIRRGVITLMTERTPMLQRVPWETIKGNAYTYFVERSLPGIAFRAVGDTWPQSTHIINPVTERIVIMGGEIFVDNFQLRTQGNRADIKAAAYKAKSRSLGLIFSEYFFEGDSTANVKVFDGIRARITGNQSILAGTNGAALTLDMMDQLGDTVIDPGESQLYMNKTLRRKITSLARSVGGQFTLLNTGPDALGKQVMKYNGIPINIIERLDSEGTFLDFDETAGSSNVTASIYLLRFGDEFIRGIQGEGGSVEVKDFGEIQSAPGHLGRIEWYPGLTVQHPRAAARLRGILNS